MTKSEVLSYLEKRLEILNKQEREDILEEVSQHIDNKMAAGLTEEDAVNDFGDVGEFADEILSAYKVNPEYQQKKFNFEYYVSRFLKKFGKIINAISDSLTQMNHRQVMGILVKFFIVVGCLLIARIPVEMIANMLYHIVNIFPGFISAFLNGVIGLCINIVYIVLVCYTLYLFIKKFFLAGYDLDSELDQEYVRKAAAWQEEAATAKKPSTHSRFGGRRTRKDSDSEMREQYESEENAGVAAEYTSAEPAVGVVNEGKAETVVDIDVKSESENAGDEAVLDDIKQRFQKKNQAQNGKEKRQRKEREHRNDGGFGNFLTTVLGFCLKIIVVFLMIPVVLFGLGTIVCFGILVALMLQGLPVIGLTIAALGCMLCLIAFIVGVGRAIFKGGVANDEN